MSNDVKAIRARHEKHMASRTITQPTESHAQTITDRATLLAENDWLRKTNRTLADNLSSESMRLAQTIDERDQLRKTNRTLADNLSSESMKLAQTIAEFIQLRAKLDELSYSHSSLGGTVHFYKSNKRIDGLAELLGENHG